MRFFVPRHALSAAVAFAATSAFAAPGDPSGPAYRVNQTAAGSQAMSSVGMSIEGKSAIPFLEVTPTGNQVLARLEGIGSEGPSIRELALTDAVGNRQYPAVGMSKYGFFLVAWHGDGDGDGSAIMARGFSYLGNPIGAPFRVNTQTERDQVFPQVATGYYGSEYTVTWRTKRADNNYEVHAQSFNSYMEPIGSEQRVDNFEVALPNPAAVAQDDSDRAYIVWSGQRSATDIHWQIWLRLFEDGQTVGAPIPVSVGNDVSDSPGVDAAPNGDVVVTWMHAGKIVARRFDRDGNALGAEFQVSGDPVADINARRTPAVAVDRTGAFTVAWQSTDADAPGRTLQYRRYDAAGAPLTPVLQLASIGSGGVFLRALAADSDGDTIATWSEQQGDGTYDVYARRLSSWTPVDLGVTAAPVGYTIQQGNAFPMDLTIANPGALGAEGNGYATGTTLKIDLPTGVTLAFLPWQQDWVCDGTTTVTCVSGDPIYPTGSKSFQAWFNAPSATGTVDLPVSVGAHQYDGNLANNSDVLHVQVADVDPDPYAFPPASGVPIGTVQISAPVVISGIDAPAPILSGGGEYSVNGGAFTSSQGTVQNGDTVVVRHTSASTYGTSVTTSLYISQQWADFVSTTADADATPDAFAFADVGGVVRGTTQTSNAITVSGINTPATINVVGGTYSVNGGAFTASAGTVSNGDQVRVQHTASAAFSTSVSTTLTIGGVSDTYTSTTEAADTTPNAFAFADVAGVMRGSIQTSNAVTLSGINAPAAISVVGGAYSVNGGAFTTAAGTVANGAQVRVRHTASAAFSTAVNTTLTIGGVSDTFTSTSEAADTAPNAFTFTDQTGVKKNTTVTSNTITVGGINAPAAITVSGGGGQYSINGGAYTTSTGTISSGSTVTLRVALPNTSGVTVNVTMTIGGVSDVWSVTTK